MKYILIPQDLHSFIDTLYDLEFAIGRFMVITVQIKLLEGE
jgi:hypothetical protein